jgi:hypothetical protein
MKKIITLLFVFAFVSTMAFAQNSASVTQSGDDNKATVDQQYVGYGGQNVAIVEQVAGQDDGNTVRSLDQYGADNLYDIYQNGNGNMVRQHPEQGKHGPSIGGKIDIDQLGDDNIVHDADQSGYGNTVTIMQEGSNNFVDVEGQDSRATGGEYAGNTVNVAQYGDGNMVGTGTGTGTYQTSGGNVINITQEGGSRAGTQTVQTSTGLPTQEGGQGLVQISGYDNVMNIDQYGSGSEVKSVLQDGSMNVVNISQGLSGMGGMHTAEVTQVGVDNTVNITQNGGFMVQ